MSTLDAAPAIQIEKPSRAAWRGKVSLPSVWLLLALAVGLPLLAVLLTRVWAFAQYSLYVTHYSYQIDYDEGVNLHAAWLLSQGQSIYSPLSPNSFVSALYTPLYYLLAAIPLGWTGPSFAWGRALSLLSTVGTAVLLGEMARRSTRHWSIGLFCSLFFMALSPVYVWASMYKQDMLALFFTLAGLYVVQRWIKSRAIYWAVPIFSLAFFTKQTALVGLAAGCSYVLITDLLASPGAIRSWSTWRRPLLFTLASLAAIAVPFFLLDLLLSHNLFLHVFTFQSLPWNRNQLMYNLGQLATVHPYLIALSVCTAGYLIFRRKFLLLPIYLAVATGSIVIANGLATANYHLLLPIFPPLILLAGEMLGELWRLHQHPWAGVFLAIAVAVLLWQGMNLSQPTDWYMDIASPAREARMDQIRNFLVTKPDPVLSEDVGMLLLTNHRVEYDDPSTFSALARVHLWDDSVLAERIRTGYFTYLILSSDISRRSSANRWSTPLFDALKKNYQILYRDVEYVYKPQAESKSP